MMRMFSTCAATALLLVAACGTDDPTMMMEDDDQQVWTPLISKQWSLMPGEEKESDLQIDNVDRDLYIGGMRPIAPQGTHHTLLFRGVEGTNMIYASGVGTNELIFPPGKGFKMTAGTVLGLQLHIYNSSDAVLTGTSGVEILEVDPATITDEVDLFLPGPKNLSLPPNQPTTQTGTCTVTEPYSVFALFPHMHQLGTHFKSTLTVGGAEMTLIDGEYDFEHQPVMTFEPIQLAVGDKITTTCTWHNPGSTTVTYGESTETEMCYSILYRFPRGSTEFCTQ